MNEEKPSKIPRVIRHWWSLPFFVALLGFEYYRVEYDGRSPEWVWIGLGVLGLFAVVLVNVLGYRK